MQPEQSPYDFILNSQEPKNRPKFSPADGSSSPLKRALIVGAIGIVVLLLFILVFSIMRSAGNGGKTALLTVAQQQTEVVRVADAIRTDTTSQAVKNAAINTYYGTFSDQKLLTTAAATKNITFNEKQLALGQSADTDTQLKNAKAAGTYDSVAVAVLQQDITAYQTALQQAYKNVSNQQIRQALTTAYNNTVLLLKQLENTQP